jgi:protoheme IX farnesyltransferase
MKRFGILRAGYNLLLLLLLILIFVPGLGAYGLINGRFQFGSPIIQPAALVILASAGTAMWIGYLRSFTAQHLLRIGSKGKLVLHSLGIGLGLAGLSSWVWWAFTRGNGVDPILVKITIAMSLVSQLAALMLKNKANRPTQESIEATNQAGGTIRDYLLLTKPIVLALLLVTTLAAMIVAAGGFPEIGLFFWTMVGGALSGGGASALNQYIDRNRDGMMTRTKRRPLPEGRLHPNQVILFGTLLCVGGFFTLAIFVNLLSALLALAGMVYYVIFYSLILKHTTTQNIVIGGGAGAIPPLVGWAAATGELSMPAFFLFALVFFWTPPHFWALALLKSRDYARAGVPMLPVIHGPHETRWQIMLYTVQVVALTLLLPLAKLGGQIYFFAALILGGGLVFYAWRLWRQGGNQPAYKMYRYSSTYLALIFAALVVDTFI